jgi:transcriptional regulator with XRE-family HTH domain
MARKKPTAQDIEERDERAQQMKDFMKNNLFSEIKLAEKTGISRRTIQMIKAGKITPHTGTIRKLNTLYNRFAANSNR